MKSFANFSEDLETRRQQLKLKQQQQAASFKEKGAAVNQAAQERVGAQKEKNVEAAERATAARDAIKQSVVLRRKVSLIGDMILRRFLITNRFLLLLKREMRKLKRRMLRIL